MFSCKCNSTSNHHLFVGACPFHSNPNGSWVVCSHSVSCRILLHIPLIQQIPTRNDPNIRDELIKNEHIITNLQITKVAEYNNLEARIDVIMFVIFGSIITMAYKLYKTKQLSQEQTVVVMITSLLVLQRYRSFTEELPDIYALSEHYRQVNQILSL
jgi:hypothetical protein